MWRNPVGGRHSPRPAWVMGMGMGMGGCRAGRVDGRQGVVNHLQEGLVRHNRRRGRVCTLPSRRVVGMLTGMVVVWMASSMPWRRLA